MEDKEKTVIQKNILDLVHDLDPIDVAPFLFQNGFLSKLQYEELTESNFPRHRLCQKFLNVITSDSSQCTFSGFLAALRYNNVYTFLAEKLQTQLHREQDTREQNEIIYQRVAGPRRQTESRDQIPTNEETGEEGSREEESRDDESTGRARLFEPVKKINVFRKSRRRISELAHKLKRLSHDGDVDKFRRIVSKVDRIYNKNKLDSLKDIKERMEYADMRFTALEAEASSRRVQYDVTLYGNPLFSDMESVIPYTTNPRVSSMTYLARYGSAVSMLESLDNGLAILQYSKHHAEHIVPCKETGMVYYIEVNLLSQKYEKEPNTDLKMEILKTAELAISQFSGEDEAVQRDYQRMLMLKMVFCRLGIGLFGNRIENIVPDENDKDAAKDCLDFIEKPEVWDGMEKRRKMLFQVAKSELYQQRSQYELALPHAKEAVRIAEENNWSAELPNLRKRLEDIEDTKKNQVQASAPQELDAVEQWLDEFEEDDSCEMEELKFDYNGIQEGDANAAPNMDNLKILDLQSNGISSVMELMRLKSLSDCFQETGSGYPSGCSEITCSTIMPCREPDQNHAISMRLLKQSHEVNDLKAVQMDTLKQFGGIQETGCDTEAPSLNTYHRMNSDRPARMEVLKLGHGPEGFNGLSLSGVESSEVPFRSVGLMLGSEQRLHELNFGNDSNGLATTGSFINMEDLKSFPKDKF